MGYLLLGTERNILLRRVAPNRCEFFRRQLPDIELGLHVDEYAQVYMI